MHHLTLQFKGFDWLQRTIGLLRLGTLAGLLLSSAYLLLTLVSPPVSPMVIALVALVTLLQGRVALPRTSYLIPRASRLTPRASYFMLPLTYY